MTYRAVYDSMVVFQWAALPPGREHATIRLLQSGQIRLCMSASLLGEIRGILSRPAIRAKAPNLTDARVSEILQALLKFADWFDSVPQQFSLSLHPKDNHLFDLAIVGGADFLVTFENRLLKLDAASNPDGQRLRALTPSLKIVRPDRLSQEILNRP